jgi:hypothetical protein
MGVTDDGGRGTAASAQQRSWRGPRTQTLKHREIVLMLMRFSIARCSLAVLVRCGLAVGIGAGQAGAGSFAFGAEEYAG